VPEVLPVAAEAVLRGLSWRGAGRVPAEAMFTTLIDEAREGAVRDEVVARLDALVAR
jgi:acetoin utilization protein AcuC